MFQLRGDRIFHTYSMCTPVPSARLPCCGCSCVLLLFFACCCCTCLQRSCGPIRSACHVLNFYAELVWEGTFAAGLADFQTVFALLDITPEGRNETGGSRRSMYWLKHKEDY